MNRLSPVLAIMESVYVITGRPIWREMTQVTRLRELEAEDARLHWAVADLTMS